MPRPSRDTLNAFSRRLKEICAEGSSQGLRPSEVARELRRLADELTRE